MTRDGAECSQAVGRGGRTTCGFYRFDARTGVRIPSDSAAYPMKVMLPAVTTPDQACEQVCGPNATTMYGFSMLIDGSLGDYGMAIYVPAPWKAPSGGCGEAVHHHLQRRLRVRHRGPDAPSVEAIIELYKRPADPTELGTQNCCLLE